MDVMIDGVKYIPVTTQKVVTEAKGIGEALILLRLKHRLSVQKAAEKIGCGYGTLRGIERDTHVPGLAMAGRIARFYGIPVEVLCELAELRGKV